MTATATIDTPPVLTDTGRDAATEAWLDELHVTWTYEPDTPIDRIDIDAGLRNQARSVPLDPDTTERYAQAAADGAVFPPILVRTRKRGRHVPLDGNHRIAAHHTRGSINAYHLHDLDDPTALLIAYGANSRNGLPLSKEERVRHAVHLVEACGVTPAHAARLLGVHATAIGWHRNSTAALDRARDLGIAATVEPLPMMQRARLGSLTSDPVFAAAAKVVAAGRLNQGDTNAFIAKVKQARSEAAALRLCGSELEDHQAAAARRGTSVKARRPDTPHDMARRALSTLAGLRPADVARTVPGPEAGAAMRRQLREAMAVAQDLDAALKANGARL